MNEFEQIGRIQEQIQRRLGKQGKEVIVDIGDDAAVLKWKNAPVVLTTDCQVEEVHFSFQTSRPEEIGYRLLAVNLSDLAAMGATPKAALVSLALGPGVDAAFLKRFYDGMLELAAATGVLIVGGNLSRSPKASVFDLTAVGAMTGKPLTRAGARPGDLIVVTGDLGDSAAGLFALQTLGARARKVFAQPVSRHLKPRPQTELGAKLVGVASSCIDISDGLSSELNHLARASGLAFWIQEEKVPVSAALKKLAAEYRQDPSHWVLNGGEEYQLLFTVAPRHWRKVQQAADRVGVSVAAIGFTSQRRQKRQSKSANTSSASVQMLRADGTTVSLEPKGWVHF